VQLGGNTGDKQFRGGRAERINGVGLRGECFPYYEQTKRDPIQDKTVLSLQGKKGKRGISKILRREHIRQLLGLHNQVGKGERKYSGGAKWRGVQRQDEGTA